MKRVIPLLMLLLLALPLCAADAVYDSVSGHDCFRTLLQKNGWGMAGPYERAAFVIEQNDGSMACEEWPSLHTFRSESFRGAEPANTIAIVHTHPAEFPLPSEHDNEEATRLGIPIYTITVRGVYKSVPGARTFQTVAGRHSWIDEKPHLTAALRADELTMRRATPLSLSTTPRQP